MRFRKPNKRRMAPPGIGPSLDLFRLIPYYQVSHSLLDLSKGLAPNEKEEG
jgi:hypothetical protein